MSLFFRKSIGAAPFKVNLSKSGIGVSAGIRGARVGFGTRGPYISAARGGVYYRKHLGAAGHAPETHSDRHGTMVEGGLVSILVAVGVIVGLLLALLVWVLVLR